MQGNEIETLEASAFHGNMTSLKNLQLNANKLKSIEKHLFCSLLNLENLNLAQNKIIYITLDAFQGLHKLKELYLESNLIEIIQKNTM